MRCPRLGFLGVGWIGRHRMAAIAEGNAGRVVAVADADPTAARAAAAHYGADARDELELLARADLDGIVIATPSALHAEQAIAALERGHPVFCQKPLARTAAECERVVAAAAHRDRLLGVDLSYRHLAAVQVLRRLLADGALGEVYAIEAEFHNAYGPDKAWFRDPALSGGGAAIDLGVHLVDLALLVLGRPKVSDVRSRLYAGGRLLQAQPTVVEDHAWASFNTDTGATVTMACSWYGHAGADARIGFTVHGTAGAVEIRNVHGSFYDFTADLHTGTGTRRLVEPPDSWGGRAAVEWARRLTGNPAYDPEVADVVAVAEVLDGIYGR
jgi:predicted dehydrogenase